MDKDQFQVDQLDLSWDDDLQDFRNSDSPYLQGFFEYKDKDIFHEDIMENSTNKNQSFLNSQKQTKQHHVNQQMCSESQQGKGKRKIMKKESFQTDVPKFQKDSRCEKQQIYSKVYRQRKKQKYRMLQEQNEYLRKKVSQLQCQIRDIQIELNRFKFPPPEKELSKQELNKQFVDMSINVVEKLKSFPTEYSKQSFSNDNYFHQFFLKSYEERGFAGKKKLKILNYHFNEILQTLLLDSEKYLSLIFANSKSYDKLVLLPQFQPINNGYLEVFKSDGDLWSRMKSLFKFLYPACLELNTHISQFYKKFQDILSCTNKIHNFLRDTYPNNNMDIARRRMEMEKCFDFYKYGKMMRKMRNVWFQWMKSLRQKEQQSGKNKKKGSKKKKIQQ